MLLLLKEELQQQQTQLQNKTSNKNKNSKKGRPRAYKDRYGMMYTILSYLKQVQSPQVNIMMINNNCIKNVLGSTKAVIFLLIQAGAIHVEPNNKQSKKKYDLHRSNSKAFYSITPKGLLLYEKLKILKSFTTKTNFLVFEDYIPRDDIIK